MEDAIMKMILRNEPDIRDAEARYREFMANAQLESMQRARERFLKQQATNLEAARNEGIEQGIKQGIEQGIEQGRRQQVQETNKEIALRLKELGVDVETIGKGTGLSTEEIEGL